MNDNLTHGVARQLHPAAARRGPLGSEVLSVIVSGLGSVIGPVDEAPLGTVGRVLLLSTDAYDVWKLVWGPGAVDIGHDHGGSVSVVQVVSGELTEIAHPFEGAGATATHLTVSDAATLSATDHHTLCNSGSVTAVSLHAYSPPLGIAGGHP